VRFYFVVSIFCAICTNNVFKDTLYAWSTGAIAYVTGAPGDKGTCRKSGCHNTFPLNSGIARFRVLHLNTSPDNISR
jgi:hypothetical protein